MPEAYSYHRDPAVPNFPDDHPIVIFDGYCALCSGFAQFVLKHDKAGKFRLLTAQSALGHALYVHYGLDQRDYETNILIADGLAWFYSEGSIPIAEGRGLPWSLAGVFRVLPMHVRDRIYAFIARNRLRIFGKRTTCYVPQTRERSRFIDGGNAGHDR